MVKSWDYNWTVLVLCFSESIAWTLNNFIIAPLLPLIIEEFRINYFQAGLISTSVMLVYSLLQFPIGFLADKFGRRNVMVFGQAWSAMVCLLIGAVSNYTQLLILLLTLGVGNGMHFVPGAALISDYFPSRTRGLALSLFFSSQAMSMLIAPIMAVPLGEGYGWRFPFVVVAIGEVIVAAAFWLIVKEPKREIVDVIRGSKEAVFRAENIKLSLVGHLTGYSMATMAFIPTFLNTKLGVSLYEAGVISITPAILQVASSWSTLSGIIVGKLAGKKAIIVSGVLSSVTTTAIALAFDIPMAIAALASQGIARSILVPSILAYAARISQPETRTTEMGFINTFWVLGHVVGPSVIGFLTDVGNFNMAFLIVSIIPLASIAIALTLPESDTNNPASNKF